MECGLRGQDLIVTVKEDGSFGEGSFGEGRAQFLVGDF